MSSTKIDIKRSLRRLGIHIKGNKVSRASFRKVFGGTFRFPEWVLMSDYKLKTPFDYKALVEKQDTGLGRAILPTSFSITRFGTYLDEQGEQVILDGLVYQYSLLGNPRNVHYAYRLFKNGSTTAKNSGLASIQSAKEQCSEQAKIIVEKELYDL